MSLELAGERGPAEQPLAWPAGWSPEPRRRSQPDESINRCIAHVAPELAGWTRCQDSRQDVRRGDPADAPATRARLTQ